MKAYRSLFIGALLITSVIGCKRVPVEVSSVSLYTSTIEMVEGDTYNLVATVLPGNAEYEGITWTSSDTSVASVSQGTVTALKEGKATITVSAGGKSATCSVTVSAKYIAVTSITLDKSELSLKVGDSGIITATVKPDDATDKTVAWTSSDTEICSVSNGIITALKIGTSTVTATAGDKTAMCTVAVWDNIVFKDHTVKMACIDRFDTDGDGELSPDEASAVTDLTGLFDNCKTITTFDELQYFTGVTALPANLFRDCSALTSVILPSSVTSLGEYCFYNCTSLKSIDIPSSVASLDVFCFAGCSSLSSIGIPAAVTSLDDFCFSGCTSLKSIEVPPGVTELGKGCFYHCVSLASIEIPSAVASLGEYCFAFCTSLESIGLPSSLISLGVGCFWNCNSLASIEIPSGVTELGHYCFSDCNSLTSIKIPSGVTELGWGCFSGCTSLTSIEMPSSVTSLGDYCFAHCTSLSSIGIPSSVTWLGESCFNDCTSLASIEIPAGVTSLRQYCFYGCTSLTSIEIPSGVTELCGGCFSGCSSLTSIGIPSGVTELGYECFKECTSLSSIELPLSVTKVGYCCFYGCSILSEMRCLATSVPSVEPDAFSGTKAGSAEGYLYVPEESVELYAGDSSWRVWTHIRKLK